MRELRLIVWPGNNRQQSPRTIFLHSTGNGVNVECSRCEQLIDRIANLLGRNIIQVRLQHHYGIVVRMGFLSRLPDQ